VKNHLDGATLLTSKALAGYLETATGRQLAFAFFLNNVMLEAPSPDRPTSTATGEAGKVLGKLCEVFYADADAAPPAPVAGPTPAPASAPTGDK
jgi:D-alanyl-D-alanine carboxypeptidase/D-alanyl-D-alanine-endopeptidase (penicillin-binding protein 4)